MIFFQFSALYTPLLIILQLTTLLCHVTFKAIQVDTQQRIDNLLFFRRWTGLTTLRAPPSMYPTLTRVIICGSLILIICTFDAKNFTLYAEHCSVDSLHCTVYTVPCTLYAEHCSVNSVHCTVYTVPCTLYTVHCTLYTVHCTQDVVYPLLTYYQQ